jgi:hypothetical protein
MPKLYNALQLKRGAKADFNRMGTLTQPVQFLLEKEKDGEWGAHNLDWLEMQGLKQIRRKAKKLLKNYKLANGVIDKSDYICEEDNEVAELIDTLTKEDSSALELKFFPIIPNVINVFLGEFSKRNDKVNYRTVDEISFNEMLEEKRGMIEQFLLAQAEMKMAEMIEQMGLEFESEEAQQMMSAENLKSLPEIEQFFKKDYKSIYEQWAAHQHEVDCERFRMEELERMAFRDMLITDSEFWHFNLREDDYDIELWNPLLTFYHKSPEVRYISQSNWVGKIDLMTVADVIDKYGWQMSKEEIESLEAIYPMKAIGYIMPGTQNDGSFYDPTKSHEWNTTGPSLAMRQFHTFNDTFGTMNGDMLDKILGESEDLTDFDNASLVRVVTGYWKSQRMIGYLTYIDEQGMLHESIVDESFKITLPGIYDNKVLREKSRKTLVQGEHVEWIWINRTWGGVKIGPNRSSTYGTENHDGLTPIYLNVKPLKFQFKGDFTLYGCKLPVEGSVFNDRNTKSTSLVDKLKPFQVGYNLVNNQIADILVDELGTVIMLDQNALPRHSMGEDWGKGNYSKAYVAMKNFQMLPMDTSITNTENALNFQHYQVLNLEQTNRLMSRVNLSNYFKQQALESIGITPQRMGNVNAQETAQGTQIAVNNSYSQTEMYFVQHSEHLMPRVHQMRTDLAQYYHSNNPSLRLQYMTSMDEKVNFQINGTELLGRDINVFVSSKINHKQVVDQIRQLALQNNTAGSSIFDLGNIIKADSLAEINHVLKSIEEKTNAQREQEQNMMREMEQMRVQEELAKQEAELRHEAEQNELNRENQIEVAKIRAAVAMGNVDLNANGQNDYMDAMKHFDKQRQVTEAANLAREKEQNKLRIADRMAGLKEKEIRSRETIADKQLQIARTNKNRYDVGGKPPKDNKKK